MDKLMIMASFQMYRAKERMKEFLQEEKGGAEIVSVIVLVAIVILLAVFFRSQLGTLVNKIWGGISGKADALTKEFTP